MDYSWRPIIIEGVNHSGTRVLVQMLSMLGSEGGDYNNPFKESRFFLELHKSLIAQTSIKGWTETIYDLRFVKEFEDDLKHKDDIYNLIKTELKTHFPACSSSPWHWKCPTSALFEKMWVKIFPEAFYIHIVRNPLDCAESFLRRNRLRSIGEGIEFCNVMNRRIAEIPKKNYLCVQYENLDIELERIRDFVPFPVHDDKVEAAKSLIIRKENRLWYRNKSLRQNFLNLRARLLSFLAKKSINSSREQQKQEP